MKKFRGKYRISSARLQTWDYGWNGSYFVTICTGNRVCYFGKVRSGVMHLSETGLIARRCWQEIPVHFPFVELSEFVVMPNHVHGIIIINKQYDKTGPAGFGDNAVRADNDGVGVDTIVDAQNFAHLRLQKQNPLPTPTPSWSQSRISQKNRFGPQSCNLASIIRGYKTGVTKFARIINPAFQWQRRYHDHIIRNNNEFDRIRNYIINNPAKWKEDVFY